MAKLRMGYVGCGFMAQKVHIPNLLALEEECELVALAELRPVLGRKVQARYGIPRLYADHGQFAEDRNIDAVAVSGHYASQGDIAVDLLMAGKDVFMEKPMAVSVSQANRILEAERASGRRLMLGYMKRYDQGNLLAKRMVRQFRETGELGRLTYMRNHGFGGDWIGGLDTPFDATDESYPEVSSTPWPEWLPEAHRTGYIGYLQQYTHNVNLLRWFADAGADVKVKSALIDPGDGLSGVAVLEVNGIRSVIESGNVSHHGWDEHTQIYFENGWVRSDSPSLLQKNANARVEIYTGAQGEKTVSRPFPQHGYLWPYKEELRHFIRAVKEGTPFESPASDSYHDIRVIEDIYKRHLGIAAE